ncbi:translation initiation factor IF-2-like [Mustela erminea]|uniref:translation initiation factor IF-2-like n=1 Tax=Mustela erminea TaxID=36723 RepID=UPI0013868F82|nr:translation initiation factor IF-2-like [Mustela erminea]
MGLEPEKPSAGQALRIERLLEVLSDRVESLQTAPEKLGRSELAERSAWEGGEFAERSWPESLPSRAAEPAKSVATASGLCVDAPRAAPPGLGVCRPSLPRPARRRPCGSRGSRGGPGRDPAQVAAPQAPGAATPCPAASWAPRGQRLVGAPCCYCCCSTRRSDYWDQEGDWG